MIPTSVVNARPDRGKDETEVLLILSEVTIPVKESTSRIIKI